MRRLNAAVNWELRHAMPERRGLARAMLGPPMYIVAITRWGPGFAEQLPELAKHLGVFPYDLRMRLNGPLPVIVARCEEGAEASALMNTLREWGHGAVGCDLAKVPASAAMHQVRDFEFAGTSLRGEDIMHTTAEVRADEVYALIHALVLSEHQQIQERTSKKFSATRAVLTGGMAMTRKSTTRARMTESSAEERIYLIRRSFAAPMLFAQHQLRYTGLGEAMGHSSHESFAALVAALRAFCPEAYYDEQLRLTRRKGTLEGVSVTKGGKTKTSSTTSSNASSVDLAAYLILVAHARNQL